MAEELDDIEEDLGDFAEKLARKEQLLNKEREERIRNHRREASDAYNATQIVRKTLDKEYKAERKLRDKELMLRKADERQRVADRKEEWVEFETRRIKSGEIRQQYLDRDSARDKAELAYKVDKFKDIFDYKKSYDDDLYHKKMLLSEKSKTDQLEVLDAETRRVKALQDVERNKLMAAEAQKSSNEVNLACWERCERTVNKAIEYDIPCRSIKKGNDYEFQFL